GRHVIVCSKEGGIVRTEDVLDLAARPDIELALLAFGIRIEARGEAAALGRHFAPEPLDGLAGADEEERVPAAGVSEREQFEELRVVVEHLLEMRHEPALVDGVAREAAAEVVIDAALGHARERELHGVEIALIAGALAGPPEEFENGRLREFRRAAHAAVFAVEQAEEARGKLVELRPSDRGF